MSILHAMYSGVSGIQAEGEALGVVGDNISNTNTVGFKAQRAVFQDVLGHSISAGTSTALPGSGVRMSGVPMASSRESTSTSTRLRKKEATLRTPARSPPARTRSSSPSR